LKPANGDLEALLAGRNAVVMWDTYVFTLADGNTTVTLTSKDKDVIPPIVPGPPETVMFLDTFDGPAGNIVTHSPNIAPVDFTWDSPDEFSLQLSLDGAGNAGSPTGENVESQGDTFVPVPMTFPFTITMDVTLSGSNPIIDTRAGLIVLDSELESGNHGIYLGVGITTANEPFLSIGTSLGTDIVSNAAMNGAHSYAMTFTASDVAISVDSVPFATLAANVPTFNCGSIEASLQLQTDPGDGGNAAHSFQLIQIVLG